MKYCKYCGAQLDDDAAVCSKCGKSLGEQQQGQTIIVQAPAAEPEVRKNGCCIAGFVLSLLGVIFFWASWVSYILLALGFILSLVGIIVGKVKKQGIGLGIAGLVLSMVDLILVLLVIFVLGSVFSGILGSMGAMALL